MNDNELRELVNSYNTSGTIAGLWYQLKMWWYFGSVLAALRIDNRNRDREVANSTNKSSATATSDSRVSSFARRTRRQERRERDNFRSQGGRVRTPYRDAEDDDDIDLVTPAVFGTELFGTSFSNYPDTHSTFGGGGDFSGGGAGGDWSEDSSGPSASVGGECNIGDLS